MWDAFLREYFRTNVTFMGKSHSHWNLIRLRFILFHNNHFSCQGVMFLQWFENIQNDILQFDAYHMLWTTSFIFHQLQHHCQFWFGIIWVLGKTDRKTMKLMHPPHWVSLINSMGNCYLALGENVIFFSSLGVLKVKTA